MARQPKQVHIYLYRKRRERYEYAIFQRKDMPFCWQGVCGGLEDNETAEEGARRELYEEAGVEGKLPLYRLESVSYLPVNIFNVESQKAWGKDVVVVPLYFFAMPFNGVINLSNEHTDVKWLPYEEAYELVFYADQKIALYELNEGLRCGNLGEVRTCTAGLAHEFRENNDISKQFNVVAVFDSDCRHVLMCKRSKEPYQGLYNLVGGKVEDGEEGLSAAYRELEEETGISPHDIILTHVMDFTYYLSNIMIGAYAGRLKRDIAVAGEENDLEWIELSQDFFDTLRFAGEGNIGHILEQVFLRKEIILK